MRYVSDVMISGNNKVGPGEDLHLTCSVRRSVSENANFLWTFERSDGRGFRNVSNKPTLTKLNVNSNDAGTYTCKASTKSHSATGKVVVHVDNGSSSRTYRATGVNELPRQPSGVFEDEALRGVIIAAAVIGCLSIVLGVVAFLLQRMRDRREHDTGEQSVPTAPM